MSRWWHVVAATLAVAIGVSPLAWVTLDEYRTQADDYHRTVVRAELMERAMDLMRSKSFEELAMLMREASERYPDDETLAEDLTGLFIRGSHSREFLDLIEPPADPR